MRSSSPVRRSWPRRSMRAATGSRRATACWIVPLAYVGFLASNVFATQQSQGLTTAEALARLGMDGTSWIVQRSALAVALVVLSGLLRYRLPAAEASAADERERLARELELEPLRAQLRA